MKTNLLKITKLPAIIALALFVSISFYSCGKDNQEPGNSCPVVNEMSVPQAVRDSFALRYPATAVIKWFNKDNIGFCALFKVSTTKKLAQFAINGNFIKEVIETNQHQQGEHQDDSTSTGGKITTGCECETDD